MAPEALPNTLTGEGVDDGVAGAWKKLDCEALVSLQRRVGQRSYHKALCRLRLRWKSVADAQVEKPTS